MTNRFFWISFPLLMMTSFFLAAFTVSSSSHNLIREKISGPERKILAKADADLTGRGEWVTVIKVKTADSLALEVYRIDPPRGKTPLAKNVAGVSEKSEFLQRLILPDQRDGYFTFRVNATNLALTDINGDHALDIVTPTFDENLEPHLNVYRFDTEAKRFAKMEAE